MKKVICILGKTLSQIGYWDSNSGDYLYCAALQTYLENSGAVVKYVHDFPDITSQDLENYDMILFAACNRINIKCREWLKNAVSFMSGLKIPIYFVGMGLQTSLKDKNLNFIKDFKYELLNFIESVYSTGGAFSIRGYKTAEIFEKFGYDNYYITGCPSMFLRGRDFKVSFEFVERKNFNPVFNGTDVLIGKNLRDNFSRYPKSDFICQDRFYKILYGNVRTKHPIKYSDFLLKVRFGKNIIDYLKNNRIKLFTELPDWFSYLKNSNFNFSFGSRIHGNIISLLCDIPALVYIPDMRVFELVELFNMPYITKINKKTDIYELYANLNYDNFNKTYKTNFDNLQNFFNRFEIPCLLEDKYKNSNIEKIINYWK